jgi:choline dehydrogenase-like flavoprotein
MIRDFHDFDDGAAVTADICVVGAGAAGIAIALEFVGTRYRVLLLEGGGLDPEAETQNLYDSEVVGLPHAGIHEGRARVFGGTTTLWGGQALRFDSFDFEERSWVPHSGWPISRRDLDPFYDRAERILKLGPPLSYQDLCASFGIVPPAFDETKLRMECSRWSPRPNFGKAYRNQIKSAPNISVLLHANVTSIITNASATAVEKVEFKALSGKTGSATARFYVVCCGAIETARLLLASDRVEPDGLGNRNGLVGRYFQEHIHIRYGDLVTTHRKCLQNCFESFYRNGLKYFPLVALSRQEQQQKGLLSIHGGLAFDHGPDSPVMALKMLFKAVISQRFPSGGELGRLTRNALAGPGEAFALAYRFYAQKRSGTPKIGPIFVGAQAEVAPNPDSRVMLSETTDPLGMRRVRLDWRLGELDRRTLSAYIRVMAGELERLGLGTFDRSQVAGLDDSFKWARMAKDSAHHMGTTRMHDSREFGVVDRDCRVHGTHNLYIGSSAVFPTSARSNPTLTILALCLRISDRLKEECARG